jgi:hypothetical protein
MNKFDIQREFITLRERISEIAKSLQSYGYDEQVLALACINGRLGKIQRSVAETIDSASRKEEKA